MIGKEYLEKPGTLFFIVKQTAFLQYLKNNMHIKINSPVSTNFTATKN